MEFDGLNHSSCKDFNDANGVKKTSKKPKQKYSYFASNDPLKFFWGCIGILIFILLLLSASMLLSDISSWPFFVVISIIFILFIIFVYIRILSSRRYYSTESIDNFYSAKHNENNTIDNLEQNMLSKSRKINFFPTDEQRGSTYRNRNYKTRE
jgi:energy-coupling factor transporter transmembrane protein EcfT